MRAAVEQVFAFEVELRARSRGEVFRERERRRAAGEFREQLAQLGAERGIGLRLDEGAFELAEHGNENLRDVHAAEFSEERIEFCVHGLVTFV